MIEPVIITFNRAEQLAETLSAFCGAGWSGRVFHVLDNASTDSTRETVAGFQKGWPGLRYHRNKWNIGGNANILRAVELSDSEYHWVIGDDDTWIFNSADELEQVLAEGCADIIRLGWLVEDSSRGKYRSLLDLTCNERFFFASVSMISATIIRRSLVTKSLATAYHNVANSFPQLVAVMQAIDPAVMVYTLNSDYMIHTPSKTGGYFCGDLEVYAGWYASSQHIVEPTIKAKYLREFTQYMVQERPGIFNELTWIAKVALNGKGMGVPQSRYFCSMLGNGLRAPVVLAMLLYFAVPGFVTRWLRKKYREINNLPVDSDCRVDRSRL